VFAIPELKKPRGQWCRHVAQGKGCSIYETRPEVCRQFTCAWLDGFGTDAERPDRSRIVFVQCEAPFGKVLAMYETIEGAMDSRPLVKRETEAALKHGIFVLQVLLGRPPRLHVPQDRMTVGRRLSDEDYQAVREIIGAFHSVTGGKP
jgi:hypothetical protein